MKSVSCFLAIALLWLSQCTMAFYIPGWSIKSYHEGDRVPLYVNKVSSDATQLPYAFYDLPFVCQPSKEAKRVGLNLGEVLRGDRIWGSDFILNQNKDAECLTLCEKQVTKSDLERAKSLVTSNYMVEWIVDNLPGATTFLSLDRSKRYYAAGFPLGYLDKDVAYLHTYFTIVVRYRPSSRDPDRFVIVAFEVYPKSVDTSESKCPGNSDRYKNYVIDTQKDTDNIRYTYSVYWREDTSIEWGSRWDMYFSNNAESDRVHWLAIVNSLVIAFFLFLMVGVILIRTLNRDIQAYKKQESLSSGSEVENKDIPEDVSGWKLVHADVFRSPKNPYLLSAIVGSGIQFLVMSISVIVFACLGFLNPSYRGGFLSYALFLFVFAGVFSGFVSARLDRTLGGERWGKSAILTALLIPGALLSIVLLLNIFVWAEASSSAIPFGTLVVLVCMWLLISFPLVLVGSFAAQKIAASKWPGRIATIPRQIPTQSKYMSLVPSVLMAGALPFAVIFVELMFIFKSVWEEKTGYYYMYGFLSLVFFMLIITVMEMSIVTTYFQLNSEDYNWWWRSFLVGTGSAWWVLLYSIYYFITQLKVVGFISSLLFFGYSLVACVIYGLITGTIGFFASFFFVRRIYGAIKSE